MRFALAGTTLGIVLLILGLLYRANYGSFPWSVPDRLQWCGRRYYRDSFQKGGGADAPHTIVFRAPPVLGRQVLSGLSAARLRSVQAHLDKGGACGLELYRRTSGGNFDVYDLSGGP